MTSEHLSFQPTALENSEINLGSFVGRGADSDVYISQDGKWAIKLYKFDPWRIDLKDSHRKLSFYRTITNRAMRLVNREQQEWVVESYEKERAPIEVLPIDSVFISNIHKCVVGVSKFVNGCNLIGFNRSPNFDIPLYSTLWGETKNLSKKLNERLGTYGIDLVNCNIKVLGQKGSYRVIVTDLCAAVSSLASVKAKD